MCAQSTLECRVLMRWNNMPPEPSHGRAINTSSCIILGKIRAPAPLLAPRSAALVKRYHTSTGAFICRTPGRFIRTVYIVTDPFLEI